MSHVVKQDNGELESFAISGSNWAPRYKDIMPEVEDYVMFSHMGYPGYLHRQNDVDVFMEPSFRWSTENFYQFFDFELIKGQPETVLTQLNSVVLSESSVEKYFGNEDPMGKVLVFSANAGTVNLTVTGVMKDIPQNSHIKADFIGNIKQLNQMYLNRWDWNMLNQDGSAFVFSYLKVSNSSVLEKIKAEWRTYIDEVFGERIQMIMPRIIMT